jgi:6-phosphofructokinase 1
MKRIYTRRILNSDVFSGMYSIVVAEGIKNEDGRLFTESGAKDSFGHIKLEGAAKYVRDALETRMKNDPEIHRFMIDSGMFVEGVLETPEIREVTPGHLVRSGSTAAYDVSFGKEIGGGAVMLLINGTTGVTIYGVVDGEIRYMPTKEAIKQRYVNLNLVSFYEQMDVCFGRKPVTFNPVFRDNGGAYVERFL